VSANARSAAGLPLRPRPALVRHRKRAGAYRLARLAVKFGAEILLDDLIVRLSADCPWRDDPRGGCGARFEDLPPQRPPDLPGAVAALPSGERRQELVAARAEWLNRDFLRI
jgi:hypothetical protein